MVTTDNTPHVVKIIVNQNTSLFRTKFKYGLNWTELMKQVLNYLTT